MMCATTLTLLTKSDGSVNADIARQAYSLSSISLPAMSSSPSLPPTIHPPPCFFLPPPFRPVPTLFHFLLSCSSFFTLFSALLAPLCLSPPASFWSPLLPLRLPLPSHVTLPPSPFISHPLTAIISHTTGRHEERNGAHLEESHPVGGEGWIANSRMQANSKYLHTYPRTYAPTNLYNLLLPACLNVCQPACLSINLPHHCNCSTYVYTYNTYLPTSLPTSLRNHAHMYVRTHLLSHAPT